MESLGLLSITPVCRDAMEKRELASPCLSLLTFQVDVKAATNFELSHLQPAQGLERGAEGRDSCGRGFAFQ